MYNDFWKPQVLECPSCGASLALPDADTFQCDYCGKLIVVPAELRPPKPRPESLNPGGRTIHPDKQATHSTISNSGQLKRLRSIVILVAVGIAVSSILMGVLFLLFIPTSVSYSTSEPSEIEIRTTPLPTMVQFARLAMVFGNEGDQPGQFDDARHIAVDEQGNIFVADYTSGRINKFDPQGNFLQLIQVQPPDGNTDVYTYAIATDGSGHLYVASNGNILKYSTASGDLLSTIPDQWPELYYDSVLVGPDGNLYATNGMAGADDVIILNPKGDLLAHWTDIIDTVNHDDPSLELVTGVSHSGMVYILSPFGYKVYGYNPDGTFNFSFGEEGEHAGQLSLSTGMLAVTQQDYLVISEAYRVDLYDQEGTYLGKTFSIDYQVAGGSMYGMTMDAHGDLYYISSGGKVLKYDMNYP